MCTLVVETVPKSALVTMKTHSYENRLEGMDETRRVPKQRDTHMPPIRLD